MSVLMPFLHFRAQDLKTKKHHIPLVDRAPLEPPPIVVVVVGPPKVGKSTLIRCLVKNYTRQKLGDICGPVTIVSGGYIFSLKVCTTLAYHLHITVCFCYQVGFYKNALICCVCYLKERACAT